VLTVDAEVDSGQVKLLCRAASPVDEVVGDANATGVRILIDGPQALEPVLGRMKGGGGRIGLAVEIVLWSETLESEVEIALPGRWPLDFGARSAIRLVPGVRDVEEF